LKIEELKNMDYAELMDYRETLVKVHSFYRDNAPKTIGNSHNLKKLREIMELFE